MKSEQTQELIAGVEKIIIPPNSGIITRRGKGGGTYAHHLIAMDFAAWLSVEFKIQIYLAYIGGTQTKKDWNIIRELASFNYKMLSVSIKGAHEKPQHYHFSNEALMINEIVFGERKSIDRETLTSGQLEMLTNIESRNAAFIEIGMSYEERKQKLGNLHRLRINLLNTSNLDLTAGIDNQGAGK